MAMPEIISGPPGYGKVTWIGLAGREDSLGDEDDLPDITSVTGSIIFKPSVDAVAYPNSQPKFTLMPIKRKVNINDSQLEEQGRAYIMLEAADPAAIPSDLEWTATFVVATQGVPLRVSDVKFSLTPGQELDLTDLINQ